MLKIINRKQVKSKTQINKKKKNNNKENIKSRI